MACCGQKRIRVSNTVMGGYKYLKPHQIRARLEVFKKNFCRDCDKRYKCDFEMYKKCKNVGD